jgi:hypothetical protein
VPINNTGSKVFNFKISGCKRLIGTPLTLIRPVPFLTNARAVAVFYDQQERKKMVEEMMIDVRSRCV